MEPNAARMIARTPASRLRFGVKKKEKEEKAMDKFDLAEKIIGYQDRLYDERGWNCAPNGADEYDAGVRDIERMIEEDGIGALITGEVIDIVDNENAHMAAAAADSVYMRRQAGA